MPETGNEEVVRKNKEYNEKQRAAMLADWDEWRGSYFARWWDGKKGCDFVVGGTGARQQRHIQPTGLPLPPVNVADAGTLTLLATARSLVTLTADDACRCCCCRYPDAASTASPPDCHCPLSLLLPQPGDPLCR